MSKLELYSYYTREDINYIFRPEVKYTPGAGEFGIKGLIRLKNENMKPDFIFFITLGQKKLGYDFIEEISEKGRLKWQSQPKQTFNDEKIKQLIHHNEQKSNIYLFIRPGTKLKEYLYLGNLSYLSHDSKKEKPVHFEWQILNWSVNAIDKLREAGIDIKKDKSYKNTNENNPIIYEESPPKLSSYKSVKSSDIDNINNVKPDYIAMQERNSVIGQAGEQLIYEKEKEYLTSNGYPYLADKVIKVSDTNDRLGYDILSYNFDGTKKFIEVKTTSGGKSLGFYISSNEIKVSKSNPDNFYLYRVFEYDDKNNSGKYYVVKGSIEEKFNLKSINYKAHYDYNFE